MKIVCLFFLKIFHRLEKYWISRKKSQGQPPGMFVETLEIMVDIYHINCCYRGRISEPTTVPAYISSWWFQTFFIFTPNPGEMIQFDGCIFFNWGWFNHQLDLVCQMFLVEPPRISSRLTASRQAAGDCVPSDGNAGGLSADENYKISSDKIDGYRNLARKPTEMYQTSLNLVNSGIHYR